MKIDLMRCDSASGRQQRVIFCFFGFFGKYMVLYLPALSAPIRSGRARQRGNQVGKTLALNQDVLAQQVGSDVAIAINDCLHHIRVLVKRVADHISP